MLANPSIYVIKYRSQSDFSMQIKTMLQGKNEGVFSDIWTFRSLTKNIFDYFFRNEMSCMLSILQFKKQESHSFFFLPNTNETRPKCRWVVIKKQTNMKLMYKTQLCIIAACSNINSFYFLFCLKLLSIKTSGCVLWGVVFFLHIQ